jgi:hypothetical protein
VCLPTRRCERTFLLADDSERDLHVSLTEITLLMLITEIIAVYSENHTETISGYAERLNVTKDGTHGYHCAL